VLDFERFLDVRDSNQVENPSRVEAYLDGSGGANRLLVFTGNALANISVADGREKLLQGEVHVNLDFPISHAVDFIGAATTVQLADIECTSFDQQTTFAVDRASTDAHDTSRFPRPPHGIGLILSAGVAIQGGGEGRTKISRLAYQANVLLHVSAVELEAVLINSIGGPIGTTARVGSGSDWEIRAKLTGPAPNPGVIVVLTSDHGELAPVPVSLFVPAGQDTSIVARPHTGRNFTSRLVNVVLTGSYRAVRTATLTIEVAPK
jgi:hypothetical protein